MATHPAGALSVVVCTYSAERTPLLERCIESIRAQSVPVHEIVVVVDHNPELLDSFASAAPDVICVENSNPRGLSGARNTGSARATGAIVAFVDDDAHVEADWAKWLMDPYEDPTIGAVGGEVVPEFETQRPEWFAQEFDWVIGCTYTGHRVDPGPVRNVIGANMSFRADALRQLGGFRSDLGRSASSAGGCEETELCIRAARELHVTTWYEPRAVAHHFVPESRTTVGYVRRRCFAEGESKATVATIAGSDAGLSAERGYVTRALPRAAWREIRAGLRGSGAAWAQLLMLVGAAFTTAAGYAWARVAQRRN